VILIKAQREFFTTLIIKTALLENTSDYKGVINISKNQTSYSIPNKFKGNLPTKYKDGKITLTYIIQVIHEHFSKKIHAIVLACIPNGKLSNIYTALYGSKIVKDLGLNVSNYHRL